MFIAREIGRFARWTLGISRKFFLLKPRATLLVVFATVIKSILQLLAFMVPLKVILLAASPGVPKYFPFIDPAQKDLWIGLLALGVIGIYITVQVLAPFIDYWSMRSGKDLLQKANDLPVTASNTKQVQRVFADFTGILAALMFLLTTVLALVWVNPIMLIWLGLSVLGLFVVSSISLRGDALPAPPFKAWLVDKPKEFIAFWEALTFFGAFGVILWPFLNDGSGSAFTALVSFILVRRLLTEFSGLIRKAVGLVQQRSAVDALFYKSHLPVRTDEDSQTLLFRRLFSRQVRDQLFSDALRSHIVGIDVLSSLWLDPSPPQVKQFLVEASSSDSAGVFVARVYGSDTQFQAEHAAFLLRHIPHTAIGAPRLVTEFTHHGYLVNIHSVSRFLPIAAKDWKVVHLAMAQDMLSVMPPEALIRSYGNTHPMLADRLTEAFCRAVEVAVGSDEDASILQVWLSNLPELRLVLRRQPLALINPDLVLANVFRDGEHHFIAINWGRWRLEPLGAGFVAQGLTGQAETLFQEIKLRRQDLARRNWNNDVEVGALCYEIETAIKRLQARQALGLMERVLDLMKGEDFGQMTSNPTSARQGQA